nr:cytosine permease [Levilactobacillus bambusae]
MVPKEHRKMSGWDMFATWIGANANNGTWYIGGVIAASGFLTASMTLVWVGILSYALLIAASWMGYKTGLGAMALTRLSFGVRGSYLASLVNVVQFIGWAAVNTFIAATSISYLFHDLFGWAIYGQPGGTFGLVVGIVIMSVLHLLSVSMGERSVQLIERIGIILVIIFVIWESIVVFKTVSLTQLIHWQAPQSLRLSHGAAADALAAFNLAWVTAGSDFSRFTTSKKGATAGTFLGANIGLFWFAFIGLVATIGTAISLNHFDPNNSDPSTIASRLGLGVLALLVIVITSTTANAVNLMSAGTALTNIVRRLPLTPALWIVTLAATAVTFIPVVSASFLAVFTVFLDGIGMFLGPEIAIFLVDYFIIRREKVSYGALNQRNGAYWYRHGLNPVAVGAWGIGIISYLSLKQWAPVAQTVGSTFVAMAITALVYGCLTTLKLKKTR